MKYLATLKNFILTEKEEQIMLHQLELLEKKFHNFEKDIPILTLVLKKHEKNHFYAGSMTMQLPKKKLIAELGGNDVSDILHSGFNKLNKEFETYKAKHFKGSSKHPSRETLRDKEIEV